MTPSTKGDWNHLGGWIGNVWVHLSSELEKCYKSKKLTITFHQNTQRLLSDDTGTAFNEYLTIRRMK